MPRPQRSIVFLCIGVVALAAFFPGISLLEYALLGPEWVLYPDSAPADPFLPASRGEEQSLALFSPVAPRGPPSLPVS